MWFSGHSILRSKSGHWGNVKRGDSQQTESSVCCICLHTRGSTVGVCVGHVSGWEQQPAGRRDHQEQAENVFMFFPDIYFSVLMREGGGGGGWEMGAVAVRWNQWQNQSLMHGTVQVLHRGDLVGVPPPHTTASRGWCSYSNYRQMSFSKDFFDFYF